MKHLYLVDVSSMYFRAFYAVRPLSTSKGLPTNALYGFLSMSTKLIKDLKPDYMAFCFDTPGPSFRKEMYDDYKANRSEMPEDLIPQVPYIRKLTDALGIVAIDKPGFEADDVIGTLTCQARDRGIEVVIVSGDKDFGQLIGSHVTMYDTLKEVKYDPAKVLEKWGVKPEQFIDYLAITGDTSDNIPGIAGIGPKGAQKLLSEYKDLFDIYDHIEDIKNKNLQNKLRESKENAFLSRKLVTIKTDMELGVKLEDLKMKGVNKEKLTPLLEELEFQSFLKNLAKNGEEPAKPKVEVSAPKVQQKVHDDFKDITMDASELSQKIPNNALLWAIDTQRGIFLAHDNELIAVQGEAREIGRQLSNKNIRWCGYDLKKFWKNIKIESPIAHRDLLLAEYLLRGGSVANFELLYSRNIGEKFPDLAGPQDYYLAFQKLNQCMNEELEEKKLLRVYETIDLPLVPVLYEMESKGILLDREELKKQSEILHKEMMQIEKEILKEVGHNFNLASPKQLADVLFNKLKIPPVKKTKTGFSTDSEVLEKLCAEYPVCKKILEHREIAKLKSTYIDALPQLVNEETGRLHTNFDQVGTATGRLSSYDPNLQNIPIRTKRGSLIRKAFIADKGCEFISADYSQIELRLLAHITGDEALCKAFAEDQDIHTATASEIFNTPLADITSDMRRMAKAVNFGIAYGQGAFGLADTLKISRKEAADIITKYFMRFKRVKEYMSSTVEDAKNKGYVETLFGRRRYIPELTSQNQTVRKFGERAAINAPMQGSASDLVKMAMIKAFSETKTEMLLQVHDELVFECKKQDLDRELKDLRRTMENIVKLKVPLKVNMSHGSNWEEAHA